MQFRLPLAQFAAVVSSCGLLMVLGSVAFGQFTFEQAPIHYDSRTPTDRVQQLADALSRGETVLEWDEKFGWLPALLEALDVPSSSQTLVFSKTSLQIRRITPSRPRALYFSDDIYMGWVQQGDLIELSAVDREQGAVFYTIAQRPDAEGIVRDTKSSCLSCHATPRTQGVPGYLVRSVYTLESGHPEFRLGTTTTDHTTSLDQRFGGWYVTGSHGDTVHRGNMTVEADADPPDDYTPGANLQTLPSLVDADRYFEPTSDIVALMVLEHQTQMHNYITSASYSGRRALFHQETMNKALDRPADYRSESTERQLAKAAESIVHFMLFCDEFRLEAPIEGNSSFASDFTSMGPRDAQGRSLRDFDLKTRMFQYPCSFLIYSPSFSSLPPPILDLVVEQLHAILKGEDKSSRYAHLSAEDRGNILAILQETHPLFRDR